MLKKILISLLVILIVAVAIIAFARVATGEPASTRGESTRPDSMAKRARGGDNWICENGEWVKHGNPSSPMPDKECLK